MAGLFLFWGWLGFQIVVGQTPQASRDAAPAASKSSPGAGGSGERPVPVLVADAVETTVPVQLAAVGTVEAFSIVQVKSQVAGQVLEVHFHEGQEVHEGDLLFTIDSRSFDALLNKEEANLAQDRIEAENAQVEYNRTEELNKGGMAASEELDQARTKAASLEAQVAADKAAVQYARLQVDYCKIRSPCEGRTGVVQVHEGNLVKANEATLTEVLEIRPIYVSFSVPEYYLPTIKRLMREGRVLQAVATIPGEEDSSLTGDVVFLDSAVDRKTGTILLKAEFPNEDGRLWPQQYVNVDLVLERLPGKVVVPSQAVQTGQDGSYVYVVLKDMTVEYRPVKTGRILDDRVVVESGLQAGERVVTDGHLRLTPGSRVEIKAGLREAALSSAPAPSGAP